MRTISGPVVLALLLVGCGTNPPATGYSLYPYDVTSSLDLGTGEGTDGNSAAGSDSGACTPHCDGVSCGDGCGGFCSDKSPCSDGSVCSSQDECLAGVCLGVSYLKCDDGDPCTSDGCSPVSGCVSAPASGLSCNDGNACSLADTCDEGTCVSSLTAECNDEDACTIDTCDPKKGCQFKVAPDGTECGFGGECVGGECCQCPSGQVCNVFGECASKDSCYGTCDKYQEDWACQCDAECEGYGDCCEDYESVCSNCQEGGPSVCSGSTLLAYDTCGAVIDTLECVYGCEDGACLSNPCAAAPSLDACFTSSSYYTCSATTGSGGAAELAYHVCENWEQCDDSLGFAFCVPKAGACSEGQVECVPGKPDVLRACSATGTWQEQPCASCTVTQIVNAVACPGTTALTQQTLQVSYDYVLPKNDYTGYATNNPVPATPIYTPVIVLRFTSDYAGIEAMWDAAMVQPDGTVTLKVPTVPTAQDYVMLAAVGIDVTTGKRVLGVFEPDLPDGKFDADYYNPVPSGSPHSWVKPVASLQSTGSKWHVALADNSWALQVYDRVRYDYFNAKSLWGEQGRTLAVWVREGTDFGCGACFAPWPTSAAKMANADAQSQMWLSTSTKKYWSAATLDHEMGHWAMASFGVSPNEGGSHYAGTKVPPGMAWSEGWATFFSSMSRGDSVYYSQSGGGMFWLDLDYAEYDDGSPLLPFSATSPLVQFMDENRVSAALWQAAEQSDEPFKSAANAAFWTALASPQMTTPPYTRTYLGTLWEDVQPNTGGEYNATYTGVVSKGTPTPSFPSYLDALLCAKPALKAKLQASTAPLPFPFNSPICK